ncbi:MAG: LPXTG cell wall anchor domain-containing protein [Pseudobutyrivibrio sp.]|nr:LPXTG cell wall anchor domain-containing protein [Pseudobutyrivibrio sp.]
MKKTKMRVINRIFSFLAALVLTMGYLPFTSVVFATEFATEPLNNRGSVAGEGAATSVKVDSANATTNLTVKLTAPGETVTIYKLASVSYDTVTKKYLEPRWVTEVDNWLKAYDNYSTDGVIKTAYATPLNLSSASEATWTEFYKYLLYNRSSSGPLNVVEYGSSSSEENGETIYLGKLAPYTDSIHVDNDATELNVTFTNLELGIYGIMVTADSKRFNPVVKDLTPKVNGPEGNYYVDSVYFAELKSAEATIDKKINGQQADAVRMSEVVDFDINITLPTLYADRVTYTRAMDKTYSMYIEDYMSPAFTLYDLNNDGIEDNKDIAFTSTGSLEGTVREPFPTESFEYYEIADSTYDKTGLIEDVDYFRLTDSNVADYTSSTTTLNKLGGYTSGETYYAIKRSAPVYTIDEITTRENADGVECTYIKLNINVGVLKQMIKDDTSGRSYDNAIVTVSYKAIVTDQIKVNSEENYNKATIVYEGTSGVSDTVRGYTYGLQVIKVDGDTDATIAGAQFNLYKELNTYINDKDGSDEFVWAADMKGSAADTLSVTYEEILNDIEENLDESIYYTYEQHMSEAGVTTSGAEYLAGDTVARVFIKYTAGYIDENTQFGGKITSVATEQGVIVSGLDEGNYVLVETKAPSGYNALAEDILFTINRIDNDTAQLEFNGSLTGFYDEYDDETKNLIESGVMTLRVLNFKGLMLPSTGGKGILLFTILGIALTSTTLVLMIARARTRDASSYM